MAIGYTQEELLGLAAKRGHRVGDAQFGRWHREGLLPIPDRQWLGKKHGSGKNVYPRRTADQLVRLCELRSEKRTRHHDHLAWYLWWEGYEVSMTRVREFLTAVAEKQAAFVARRQAQSPEARRVEIETELGADKRFSGEASFFSRVRRRVGKDGLPDFATDLLGLLTEDDPDATTIVEGLGIEFFFGQVLGKKMLGDSEAEEIVRSVRAAVTAPQAGRVAAMSDTELCSARDHLQSTWATISGLAPFLGLVGGDTAARLVAATQPTQAVTQAQLLLTLEPLLDDPDYAGPKPEADTVTIYDLARLFEVLGAMMREVPALADWEILTPRKLRSAVHNPNQLNRLALAVQIYAREHPREFDEFLTAHPEVNRHGLFSDEPQGRSTG